mgnify:CR=1 FL=1
MTVEEGVVGVGDVILSTLDSVGAVTRAVIAVIFTDKPLSAEVVAGVVAGVVFVVRRPVVDVGCVSAEPDD